MTVPEVSQDTLWYDSIVDTLIKKETNESSKLAASLQETAETDPKTTGSTASESTP
jgi:hypothetical protein